MTDISERPLDPHVLQRKAANPAVSAWVAASAGTGKTKVLTDRVLRLLLAGTPPSRILCLTFTKAAAAEMANRLNDVLSPWAIVPESDLDRRLDILLGRAATGDERTTARRLFTQVLECPGGMKIQTIHSFCQSLLARFPIEAGIRPGFSLLEERGAKDLSTQAMRQVLADIRVGQERGEITPLSQALGRISRHMSAQAFQEILDHVMAQRSVLQRLMETHGGLEKLCQSVRRQLGIARWSSQKDFLHDLCQDTSFDCAGLAGAAAVLAEGSKTDKALSQTLATWLTTAEDQRAERFAIYAGAFVTSDDGPEPRKIKTKLGTKAIHEKAPDLATLLQAEAERVRHALDIFRAWDIAEKTESLLHLGYAFLTTYTRMKESHGWMDYDDLILTAWRLLTRENAAPWVLYKLDGGLDHLLVDEAQDTNPEQWQIIAALADEFFSGESARGVVRSLFVVGDEKQSIFSFQRANVAEFNRMRSYFQKKIEDAGHIFQPVDLTLSFRSTDAVLKAVDKIFSIPTTRQGVSSGAAALEHHAYRRGHAGHVELWPLVAPKPVSAPAPWSPPLETQTEDSPPARMAAVIAAQIRQWLDTKETLLSQGRPIRPGDVLILVRTRGVFFEQMVRALKNRQVPVAGLDRMVLTDALAVKDLMALGDFLLLPEDDLTLAALLKSPLIGLSEDDLYVLAQGRGESETLWNSLRRKSDKNPHFKKIYDWLSSWLDQVDFISPFALFDGLLSRACPADPLSGRRAFLTRLGVEAEDPLNEFLSTCLLFERQNLPALQSFLAWMRAEMTEVKREMDVASDKDDGQVRIMTVHASKGLQAPIVFLPDTTSTPLRGRTKIFWPEASADIPLFAPRKGDDCRLSRQRRLVEETQQEQEYRRLLYVALTRAADRLYISGWQGERIISDACWYSLVHMAFQDFGQAVTFDFTSMAKEGWAGAGRLYKDVQIASPAASTSSQKKAVVEPFPEALFQPAPAEDRPSRPLTPSRPDIEDPPVSSPIDREDRGRFQRGLLIHHLLQILPSLPVEKRALAPETFLALPGHGLPEVVQKEIVQKVLAVLNAPDFAPLFGPGSQAEVPLVAVVGERVISGQIDRLCVLEDQVWIVDYKTQRLPPESADNIPAAYLAQMAAYREAVRRLWPGKAVRAFLLWTEGPRLMEVPDSLLDTPQIS